MSEKRPPSIARMRKPHSAAKMAHATAGDGRRIVEQQSLRNALLAGLIVVIVFSMLWAMLSTLLNKIFPWMTMAGTMMFFDPDWPRQVWRRMWRGIGRLASAAEKTADV